MTNSVNTLDQVTRSLLKNRNRNEGKLGLGLFYAFFRKIAQIQLFCNRFSILGQAPREDHKKNHNKHNKVVRTLVALSVALAIGLLTAGTIQAKEVSFASSQLLSDETTSTGSIFMSNLVSADMDGDGDQDIIVSQYGSDDSLSWLENDGGDFTDFPLHVISTARRNVSVLTAVDIDSDGDLDIVMADSVKDELLWIENSSSATVWTERVIDSGSGINTANQVALADLDADGDLDIALAAAVNSLYWYENTGNAATWVQNDTGITPAGGLRSLAVGDVDLNGTVDIVYALISGSPSIVLVENTLGDGSSWTTSTINSASSSTIAFVQLIDLNKDGIAELYSHVDGSDILQWNYDSFASTWSSTAIISNNAYGQLDFSDIDGDGDLDLLSGSNSTVSWYENTDGVGSTWTQRDVFSNSANLTVNAVRATDMDDDGDLDIVLAKNEDGYVYAYENLQFHSSPQLQGSVAIENSLANAYHVLTAKMNGDQYWDVIAANKSTAGMKIYLYEGQSDGSFASFKVILDEPLTTDKEISALAVGDMDNDGDLDVVFAADGSDSLYSVENLLDSGPFINAKSQATLAGASWGGIVSLASAVGRSNEIQLVDINADGTRDVVFLDQLNNKLKWLSNDGSWTAAEIGTATNPSNLKVADINGDGSIDLLTSGNSSGGAHLWSNDNGDASSWSETTIDNGKVPRQIAIADMDSDGDIDIVYGRSASSNILWQENNSDGTWTRHDTLVSPSLTAEELVLADGDNDGDIDVYITGATGEIEVLVNEDIGTESWTLRTVFSGLSTPKSFTLADFDTDGDLDMVSTGTNSSEVVQIENTGGQFGVDYETASAQNSEELETSAVVRFVASHVGKLADGDMQLSQLQLGFIGGTGCAATEMINSDFNPLVSSIGVYLDDGSGVFEKFSDQLVSNFTGPFVLNNGELTLVLADQDENLQIAPLASKEYFVTLTYRNNAAAQACRGLNAWFILGEGLTSQDILRAQDRDSGIELQMSATSLSVPGEQLIVASTNTAPTTTGIADANGTEGILFTLDISSDFSDADGDELFFTASGLPQSFNMASNTGIISGTANNFEASNSPFTVTVLARDPQDALVNSTFTLSIANVNSAPIFNGPITPQVADFNVLFVLDAVPFFTDPDGDSLSYTATGLPDGLAISADGVIAGAATALALMNSPYSVVVTAQDTSLATISSNSFVLNVTDTSNDVIFANGMD